MNLEKAIVHERHEKHENGLDSRFGHPEKKPLIRRWRRFTQMIQNDFLALICAHLRHLRINQFAWVAETKINAVFFVSFVLFVDKRDF